MSKPTATREQVLEYVKYYFGNITASNAEEFMRNLSQKSVKYVYFSYSASRDCYIRHEGEAVIGPDEELALRHIPYHIINTSSVIISEDRKVLKDRLFPVSE